MTSKRPEPPIDVVIRLLRQAGEIVGRRRMRLHLVDRMAEAIVAAWAEKDHQDKRRKRG